MGDLRENVESRKEASDIFDLVSVKLQSLALLGFEEDVISAWELIGESCMTTILKSNFMVAVHG